jgi:hypothetical protein
MHRDALLTPEGRFRLCLLIEGGWTVAAAAESIRISDGLLFSLAESPHNCTS